MSYGTLFLSSNLYSSPVIWDRPYRSSTVGGHIGWCKWDFMMAFLLYISLLMYVSRSCLERNWKLLYTRHSIPKWYQFPRHCHCLKHYKYLPFNEEFYSTPVPEWSSRFRIYFVQTIYLTYKHQHSQRLQSKSFDKTNMPQYKVNDSVRYKPVGGTSLPLPRILPVMSSKLNMPTATSSQVPKVTHPKPSA